MNSDGEHANTSSIAASEFDNKEGLNVFTNPFGLSEFPETFITSELFKPLYVLLYVLIMF